MRPTESGGKFEGLKEELKDRTILIVVIIVVFCIAVASVYAVMHFDVFSDSYFKSIELEDGEISSGEITTLEVELVNPTEKTFDNLSVEVSTRYSKLTISRPNRVAEEENGEYVIRSDFSEDTAYFPDDTSPVRNFEIEGELHSGLNYLESNIEVRVYADEELVETKVLELAVSS